MKDSWKCFFHSHTEHLEIENIQTNVLQLSDKEITLSTFDTAYLIIIFCPESVQQIIHQSQDYGKIMSLMSVIGFQNKYAWNFAVKASASCAVACPDKTSVKILFKLTTRRS